MRNWLITLYVALSLALLGTLTAVHAGERVLHEATVLVSGMICDTEEDARASFETGIFQGTCGMLMAPMPVRVVEVGEVRGHSLVRYEFLSQDWVQYGVGPKKEDPQQGA